MLIISEMLRCPSSCALARALLLVTIVNLVRGHAQKQAPIQPQDTTSTAPTTPSDCVRYNPLLIHFRPTNMCYIDDESEQAELNQNTRRPKCTPELGCDILLNCHNYTISNATLGDARVLSVLPKELQSIIENQNVTNNCVLVMFYAPWCEYSVLFARRYNTLGRMFRELPILAVDLSSDDPHKYVLAYLPVVALYHQGKVVYRFKLTESVEELRDTVINMTKLPALSASLEDSESEGPVPVVRIREELPLLYLSTAWIVFVSLVYVLRSSRVSSCINRLWRVRAN